MTITEIVEKIRLEVANTDLQPSRAAELLTKLSALMGNCLDEIRVRDMAYSKVLIQYLESEEKANRAKIRAEISPEYEAKRKAKDTFTVVEEMVRSLKYLLKAKESEYKQSGNQ